MASKLTQYINSKLNEKGFGANPEGIKEAKERGKKHSSIAAAKKAGDLYYKDPKTGKMMIAAYAEDLKGFVADKDRGVKEVELEDKKEDKKVLLSGGTDATQGRSRRGSETISKETTEKRAPSKRIQALKGVSNAKLASRIRAKLNDPSFRKSRGLNTLKNSLEAALKIDTSSLRGERMQKMQLDSLLSKVDRMIMNTGGMVNPTTGLKMNAMGNIDYRTTGMFYGGGMTIKR